MFQDLKYALRTFRQSPGFVAAALATLGLGIGANVIVFSHVNSALIRPYPYTESERLAVIVNTDHTRPGERLPLAYPDVVEIRKTGVFSGVAVHDWEPYNLRLEDGTVWVGGGRVSSVAFPVLGINAIVGRTFLPDEDRPGAAPVVVLGEALWRSAFAGDPDVVGGTVTLDGQPYEVVGVVPATADMPEGAELWVPLPLDPESSDRVSHWLPAYGRLADGVSWEQARARLHDLAAQLETEYRDTNENRDIEAISFREARTADSRTALIALLGAAAFLLLIVCASVANLFLARASSREREMGVRVALGASRGRLIRQLLTESLLLAAAACLLGLLLGAWGVVALPRLVPVTLPSWLTAGIDFRVVAFSAAVSALAALAFGLAPALQLSTVEVGRTLRQATRGGLGTRGGKLRDSLVLIEVALSVALLTGGGLLIRSFLQLSSVDPGFADENRLVATLQLASSRYDQDADLLRFTDRLIEEIEARPGVVEAAFVTRLPLRSGTNRVLWWHDAQSEAEFRANLQAELNSVSPDYFRAMGIPLAAGRGFAATDDESGPDVLIINRSLAERYWPDGDAIGRRISFAYPPRFCEVVGVVGDVRHQGLDQPPNLQMYTPYAQRSTTRINLVVHTAGDAAAFGPELQRILTRIDPDQALSETRTLTDITARSIWQQRLLTQLFWLLGGFAVLLAAVGIYGVVAYAVARRTREIALRIALGATKTDVAGLVMSRTGWTVLFGLAAGLVTALGISRALQGSLYGVSAFDPVTYVAVTLFFAGVAALAALLPARRASRIAPMAALRSE